MDSGGNKGRREGVGPEKRAEATADPGGQLPAFAGTRQASNGTPGVPIALRRAGRDRRDPAFQHRGLPDQALGARLFRGKLAGVP